MMHPSPRRIALSLLLALALTMVAPAPGHALPLLALGAVRAVAVTDALFVAGATLGVRAAAAGSVMAVAGSGMAAVSSIPRVAGASLAGVASTPLVVQSAIVGNHTALIGGMLVPVVAVAAAVGN